jgi:hypothetical protein
MDKTVATATLTETVMVMETAMVTATTKKPTPMIEFGNSNECDASGMWPTAKDRTVVLVPPPATAAAAAVPKCWWQWQQQ